MEDEIQEARQALSSTIDTLQYKADLHQLQLLIDKANEIEPKLESEYVDIHQRFIQSFPGMHSPLLVKLRRNVYKSRSIKRLLL